MPRPSKKRSGKAQDGTGAEKTTVGWRCSAGPPSSSTRCWPKYGGGADRSIATGTERRRGVEYGWQCGLLDRGPGIGRGVGLLYRRLPWPRRRWRLARAECQPLRLQPQDLDDPLPSVATQYLAHYLGWRRLLDRFKDTLTPLQFLFHALRISYPLCLTRLKRTQPIKRLIASKRRSFQ